MPPPVADLSDDESTGESIPYDEVEGQKNGVEESNDGDEDEEEDEYIVEKILGHSFKADGTLLLQVKWQGYSDPKDQTTEPEENLDNAPEVLEAYFKSIGGRPEKPAKKRKSMGRPAKAAQEEKPEPKRRRKSRTTTDEETATPEVKKEEKEKNTPAPEWVPKTKSWENEVRAVDTIVREGEGLVAYLHWNNDKKSKVSIETCYDKCPRKMLKFYEQHLVFKDSDA